MKKATKEQIHDTPSLKKRAEFLRVQNGGKKWVSPGVIVMVAPLHSVPDAQILENPADLTPNTDSQPQKPEKNAACGQNTVRFGLTVTKKLSKSAVVRNRMRRRLRAAAFDVLPAKAARGHDYVLIARPETKDYPYDKLCADLKWCLKRLSCLQES